MGDGDGEAELAVAVGKYHLSRARCSNQFAPHCCVVHPWMEPLDLQYGVHLLSEREENFTGRQGQFRFA
jgi:hypothetical protein